MRTLPQFVRDACNARSCARATRWPARIAFAAAALIGALLPTLAVGQGAPGRLAAGGAERVPPGAQASEPGLRAGRADAVVTVMVEMQDPPAGLVYADSLRSSALREGVRGVEGMTAAARASAVEAATSVARAQAARIESAQQAILPSLRSLSATGKVVFRAKSAYNGISMPVARSRIAELKGLPGVKEVRIMTPDVRTAANSIDFVGGRSAWLKTSLANPTGLLGDGIKVAIIDSGLDYLHANFGGPGTPAAYAAVTDAGPVPNAYFPSAKVPGGYDFAGDAYDASRPAGTGFDAVPDPNPMDSVSGHGTAVASLIGGLGMNADGSTYAGPYNGSTDLDALKVAPGFAPKAMLYPLRVFGVSGSTNLTVQALEWALDPNGDGNFADRMDVVNMSLGSPNGDPGNPTAVATANVVAAGVVVVASAGNSGDFYFITGSPAVANGAMSVAASFNDKGGYFYNSTVTVNSPVAIAGTQAFTAYGNSSPPVGAGGLTADLAYTIPANGCTALTNAGAVAGKIALVDRGTCNFSVKVTNAFNAGAVAVIVANNVAGLIAMNLEGVNSIPAVMMTLADANTIKAQLGAGVNVTITNSNGFVPQASTAADTLPTYSSRGPRIGDGMLKPDITAPAEVVGVAASLKGTEVSSFNGTSSAAPHVAGIMTALRQLHPTWTVEELMAAAMNTATHDLFTGPGGTGSRHGLGRVGAGRVDVTNAVATSVVAYNDTNRGLVSVSFGIVEVPVDSTTTLGKTIAVVNKGAADVEYAVSYVDVTPVAGAAFTVGTTPTITVPAGGTVTLPVTFTATGNLLRHVREAAVPGTSGRHWLTEKTGYAVLTPTGGSAPTLRVPLHAAPKPVSSMRTTQTVVFPSGATGTIPLGLGGAPVQTGSSYPIDIVGLVKPFELQYRSPLADSGTPPTDPNRIKHVGVSSDYVARAAGDQANTVVTFALEGFGPAFIPASPGSDKEIFIDANRDGTMDYGIYLASLSGAANSYVPQGIRLSDGAALTLRFYTNGFAGTSVDTNAFASNVVVIPVQAADMGLVGGASTRFDYRVVTYDRDGVEVDSTGVLTYDLARPGIEGQGGGIDPSYYEDLPTTTLPINYNAADYQANGSLGVLVVHMHNASGSQGEARIPRNLSVSRAGNGSGTVAGAPAVIDCGTTCSAAFLSGSLVTLTATPATGSHFTGWSGACTGTGTCQVTMDAAKTVTATFTLQQFTLSVAKDGNGTGVVSSNPVAIDCGAGACASAFNYGAAVTLTATGTGGSTFSGWGGACSGTGTCQVTMTAAASVTATFAYDAMADTDGDGIPNGVELAEGRNPDVKDNDIFSPGSLSARLFAMQLYRDFLNREGDPAGIQGWTDLIVAGTYSRLQVIDAFLQSQEFGGFVAPVVRLYFATFLRVPDYDGLVFNAGLVRAGTLTPVQLADFFANSPEFLATYGALSNTQFVTLLYNNVLGRAPDPDGLNGWVALLNGGMSRGQVLYGFAESPEYQAAMANEVFVTMMYAGMMRRSPEPSGFSGWVSYLDGGTYTREQVINGFYLSTEYGDRFLP